MQPITAEALQNPSIVEPKQVRSRRTVERIVAVACEMIETQGYDAVSMGELARTANVGLGSLYNRFPSKERLLTFLANETVIGKLREDRHPFAAPGEIKASSISDFLKTYCRAVADVFCEHRAILRPMSLLSRTSKDIELTEYIAGVNEMIHAELAAAIQRLVKVKTNSKADLRIVFAVSWMGSALREQYLFAANPAPLDKVSKQRFAHELAAAISAYLTRPLSA